MRRSVYIVLLLFLKFLPGYAQVNRLLVQEGCTMYSHILKQEVKYSVCLPEMYYQSVESYPVVYMLHGLGDESSSWLEYGQIDLYSYLAVNEGRIIPMIYVMPEGYRTYYVNDYYGKFAYQDMFIRELIPHIDSLYRTVSDASHRATIGYSMGGFGALMLAVKNPSVFQVSVPLSISVRTDRQYETEEANGWDEQWGRLFGGIHTTGSARLTDYYRQYSPFHVFEQQGTGTQKIMILNGDDEYTLARSNEELHILMRDKKIPHEYRVRNGGHEFTFWKESMYDALNFISDAFLNKPYRGDKKEIVDPKPVKVISFRYQGKTYGVSFPPGYERGNRLYPVTFVDAELSKEEKKQVAGTFYQCMLEMKTPPQLVVFTDDSQPVTPEWIECLESMFRIRKGWRFRSMVGYRSGGNRALKAVLTENRFTSIVCFDAALAPEDPLLGDYDCVSGKTMERNWLYVDAPDKGSHYAGNGEFHVLLREKEIYHEYRVREGSGDVAWMIQGLPEALVFIGIKLHK